MARGSKQAPPPQRLLASSSAFDFLEGSFAATQRGRKVAAAATAVAVLALAATGLFGAQAVMAQDSDTALLAQVQTQNATVLASLAKNDNAGGFSADQLTAHVTERERAYKAALVKEIDVVALIRALRASAPAGVEITSVTFHDAAAAAANTAPVTGAAGTAAPRPQVVSMAGPLGTVEVKGTVKSFKLIKAWAQSASAVHGLTMVNPTWSGGGSAISTTLTATITTDGLTARAQALRDGAGKVGH